MTYEDVDALFVSNAKQGYEVMKKRVEAGSSGADDLWRMGRFCNELANQSTDDGSKKKYILEGREWALKAYAANNKSFDILKLTAVLAGKYTDYLGTKDKIEESANFKKYLDEALALNASDHVLLHLRGRYAYSLANLSWIERKAAEVFFATPPKATIDDALTDFLAAEQEHHDIENRLFLARCYIAKDDKASAKKYLTEASQMTPKNEVEKQLLKEITKTLGKL